MNSQDTNAPAGSASGVNMTNVSAEVNTNFTADAGKVEPESSPIVLQ
jgi:hypothetical protein